MFINYVEKNSDQDGPVLDIHYSNAVEAFQLGRLFEQIVAGGRKAWIWDANGLIRIPLIEEKVNNGSKNRR